MKQKYFPILDLRLTSADFHISEMSLRYFQGKFANRVSEFVKIREFPSFVQIWLCGRDSNHDMIGQMGFGCIYVVREVELC